jgi:hypothetical protein
MPAAFPLGIHQIPSGKELFGLTPRVTFGELSASASHKIIPIGKAYTFKQIHH